MMKLYYSPGACSMSCHIALEESGLPFEGHEVSFDDNNAAAQEVQKRNPLGAVPVLVTGDGKTLTQNAAILTYIADQAPKAGLFPTSGWERAEAMQWLAFVTTDFHKSMGSLFGVNYFSQDAKEQEKYRNYLLSNLEGNLKHLDTHLANRQWILGNQFSLVDGYAFTVFGWSKWLNVPTDSYKNLSAWATRVYARPAVQKVMKKEDLLD
jgi:glutathione S-transferase